MDHRSIDFAGHSLPVVRDSGIDWVAVRPILAYLYRDKDQTGELQSINQKYETSVFNLPTAHGNRVNQKCIHSGQLETWLYSFTNRRSHFKHPDGQFLSRVKHARELLPGLILESAPVEPEVPEVEEEDLAPVSSELPAEPPPAEPPPVEPSGTESLGELSEFARVYSHLYITLVMGFYFRAGEIPELVRNIAEVWANGVAELYEESGEGSA